MNNLSSDPSARLEQLTAQNRLEAQRKEQEQQERDRRRIERHNHLYSAEYAEQTANTIIAALRIATSPVIHSDKWEFDHKKVKKIIEERLDPTWARTRNLQGGKPKPDWTVTITTTTHYDIKKGNIEPDGTDYIFEKTNG